MTQTYLAYFSSLSVSFGMLKAGGTFFNPEVAKFTWMLILLHYEANRRFEWKSFLYDRPYQKSNEQEYTVL